jgi:sugar lactone lactonase YvrE
VQVFDAKGQYLGTIKAGRQAANVAFGGPGKSTLYLTARGSAFFVHALSGLRLTVICVRLRHGTIAVQRR